MKKTLIAILAAAVLLGLAAFFIVRGTLASPGYHEFLGVRSFNYSGPCFICDPETGGSLEPSTLEVKAKLHGAKTTSDAMFRIPGLVEAADGFEGYAAYNGDRELFYKLVRTDLTADGADFTQGNTAALTDMGSGCAIIRIDPTDGSELWALFGYADEKAALEALKSFTAN